jgi:hypothetical protein
MDNLVVALALVIVVLLLYIYYTYAKSHKHVKHEPPKNKVLSVSHFTKREPTHEERHMQEQMHTSGVLSRDMVGVESHSDMLLQTIGNNAIMRHRDWVGQVKPHSSVPRNHDSFNPGDYIPFVGLQRPVAVKQRPDALFITEVDGSHFEDNHKLRFK